MKEICPIWEKLLLETIKVNQVVQKQIIAKRKEKQMAEFFRRVEKKYILTKNQYLEINASDGSSTEGIMGQNVNSNVGIIINGGEIYINATGDGIDSNGSVYINGGKTVIAGPTSDGDSSLDYDGVCVMNGGKLICYGSTGMWQSIGTNSTVYEIVFYNSGNSGDEISVKDSNGSKIASFETTKKYSGVGVASDKIENGETYTLYVNGEETASITVTGTVTANGSNQKNGNQMNYTNTKNFH